MIEQAKKAFVSLPAEQYFDLILKLVSRHALPKEG